uniref:uncharacterized protein LOC108950074 n=1 Tax=Ciona intestinalis TaxID=7719 RepID=UPI000EF43CE5|nr:uncharacterized protein LOC108950074 [Ciona intestinalis]|eukprot:XP_018670371.2 uncharacterized protein LOC108950074 [Ciona intestinalis]
MGSGGSKTVSVASFEQTASGKNRRKAKESRKINSERSLSTEGQVAGKTTINFIKKSLLRYIICRQGVTIDNAISDANIKLIYVKKNTPIVREGDSSSCIYVIIDGQCEVHHVTDLSEHDVPSVRLRNGDVFGLRSALSGEAALDTVQAGDSTYVAELQAAPFRKLSEDLSQVTWSQEVQRFWVDASTEGGKTDFDDQLSSCLLSTTLFQLWTKNEIRHLISNLHWGQLWWLPRGAELVRQGEAGTTMYILCKGSLSLLDKMSQKRVLLRAKKFSFVIGEEVVYNEGKYTFTLFANEPSFVLPLPAGLFIKHQHSDETQNKIASYRRKWDNMLKRKAKIPDKYLRFLQHEVLLVQMRQIPAAAAMHPAKVNELILQGRFATHGAGEILVGVSNFDVYERAWVFTLLGKLELEYESKTRNSKSMSLVRLPSNEKPFTLKSLEESVTLYLPSILVQQLTGQQAPPQKLSAMILHRQKPQDSK